MPRFRHFLLLACLLLAPLAQAAKLVEQTFATDPTWNAGSGWFRGGTTNPAVINGWLRLTGTSNDAFGYVYYNTAFNVNQGFVIDFEFASWGGSGADGLTVFLYDGTVTSNSGAAANRFRIGAAGGSLGYANDCNNGAGMRRAFVGIAFDEFGNFANPGDRCKSGGPGEVANAVTLRGAGDYTTGPVGNNYRYLTNGVAPVSIDCPACATRPAETSAEWRRARITMLQSSGSWSAYVDVQFGANQPFTRIVNPVTLPSPPYTTLKIGFAASTGGSTNNHEIRNVLITNPVDTTLTKTVSAANVVIPGPFSYTLNVANTNISAAANVKVTDTLPTTQVQYLSATVTPSGSCNFAPPTLTCDLGTLALNATRTITVNARGLTQGTATNTATVTQDDIDITPNNNTSTVSNAIWNTPLLVTSKTASVATVAPGGNILYTVTTSNSGGPATNTVITDNLSPFTALQLNYAGAGQPFQLLGSSGLILGTPVYSSDNGATWTYTPVSGGGGAPAGYDGNVTHFRIPMGGTLGGGGNFSIRFNTVVE